MTDIAPRRFRDGKTLVHPLTVRLTHWANALAVFIMIASGWRIYNSDPIFPFYFPVDLTLGGSYDGSVDIHNEDGLAGALQWHFAGMWLFTVNGIIYAIYGILSGHFRRAFFQSDQAHSFATPLPRSNSSCRIGSAPTMQCKRRSTSAC